MHLKRYTEFITESNQIKRPWIYEGDFKVLPEMVLNDKLIKEKMPDEVTGHFNCYSCKLISLEGCPKKVGGSFDCSNNQLTSLEGCPISIDGDFKCHHNFLTSLEGITQEGVRDLDCSCNDNSVDLTIEKQFIKSSKYTNKETYWIDLLQYMINEKIDLGKVKGWPKGFLTDEIIASAKGIAKFDL